MKKILLSLILILVSFGLQAQATWTQQTTPAGILTDLNSAWAVNANVVWMCGPGGVVIRTTNAGATWALANTGITGDLYCITAVSDQLCMAGSGDGAIWRTTNGGTTWNFIIPTPAPAFFDAIHMFDANTGFALSDPQNVAGLWCYYITTDAGATWTAGANRPANVAGEAGWNGSYMALDTGHIWFGTNKSKIYKGGLKGPYTSGTTSGLNQWCMGFNDANIGAAAQTNGTNPFTQTFNTTTVSGGTTWSNTSFTPNGSYSMKGVPFSGYMWMGGTTDIYASTNSGVTFTSQFTLPTNNACYGLTFVNVNLGWACTQANPGPPAAAPKIYKYTNNIVGIGPNNGVPVNYSIDQNFPNPFNPTTNIRYSLPKASNVTVKIYDVLGNEVMTVVNAYQNAGYYTETIDASNLSSGVYFYTIRAGDYAATKKMSLIK